MASADGCMPISAGGHFVPLAPAAGVKRPLPDRAGTGALVRVGRAQPRDRRLGEAEPPAPCCWQGLSAHGWGSRAQAWSHDPPTHPGVVLHPKFAGGYRTLRGRQDRAWGDPPPDTGRLSPDTTPPTPPHGGTALGVHRPVQRLRDVRLSPVQMWTSVPRGWPSVPTAASTLVGPSSVCATQATSWEPTAGSATVSGRWRRAWAPGGVVVSRAGNYLPCPDGLPAGFG